MNNQYLWRQARAFQLQWQQDIQRPRKTYDHCQTTFEILRTTRKEKVDSGKPSRLSTCSAAIYKENPNLPYFKFNKKLS